MIRLVKGPIPAELEVNAVTWRDEYANLCAEDPPRGASFSRYRRDSIKSSVLRETHEKCAYCESKMRHVDFGDVEHMLPKARRPDLVVDWANLTLVCAVCNNEKRAYYDPVAPLLNPYLDDPQAHVFFGGAMIFNVPGSELGRRTILRLRLDRTELVERRQERLALLRELADTWAALPAGSDKDLAAEQLRRETADDREYAALVRDWLRIAAPTV